jgi:hypothetical protein
VSECTHLANKAVELLPPSSPCSSMRPVLLRFLKAFPVCLKAYLRRPGSRALNEQLQGCAVGRGCRLQMMVPLHQGGGWSQTAWCIRGVARSQYSV